MANWTQEEAALIMGSDVSTWPMAKLTLGVAWPELKWGRWHGVLTSS